MQHFCSAEIDEVTGLGIEVRGLADVLTDALTLRCDALRNRKGSDAAWLLRDDHAEAGTSPLRNFVYCLPACCLFALVSEFPRAPSGSAP